MKRLVLMGEGHGESNALPALVRRLLRSQAQTAAIPVYEEAVRTKSIFDLVKWDGTKKQPLYDSWLNYVQVAARHANGGAVLAVYDGDIQSFPVASKKPFCTASAAKDLARVASSVGAGRVFSLGFVFAHKEFETWIIAGAESLKGKRYRDDRSILKDGTVIPTTDLEIRGKGWLENNGVNYRPSRDQAQLAELVDLELIRSRNLRSFVRLEKALSEMVRAIDSGSHVCTPA